MSISSVCDRDDKVVLVLFQLLLDIMLFFTSADVHYSCSMMIMRMLVVMMVMMIDFTNQSSTLTTSHQTNDSINHKEKCASKLHTRNHSTFPLAFFFFAAKRMTASVSFLLLLEQNRCQCADGKHIHRDKWNAFDLSIECVWKCTTENEVRSKNNDRCFVCLFTSDYWLIIINNGHKTSGGTHIWSQQS